MGRSVEKKEFNVLGKTFIVSEERARFNKYRAMYSKMAEELSDKYLKVYLKEIKDIDGIHEKGHQQGLLCIFEAITKTINILVEHKIYDIDEDVFFNKYFREYYTWDDVFNQVDDRYMSIICSAEELREYREARKESRGRFVGGGFSIQGAIKGSMQAGAMNLATGAAYGVLNYFENKATEKRVRQEKAALTEDPTVYSTLVEGIKENVFNVLYALYDIIGHLDKKEWDIVSDEEEEKVNTLLVNLPRVKDLDGKNELLLQCLQLNPYNTKIYDAILADGSLEIGEIGGICEFFKLDIKKILAPVFKKELDKCEKTEQGINECIDKLSEKMSLYGVSDTFYIDEAYKKLEAVFSKKYKQEIDRIKDISKLRSYQEEMIEKINMYQIKREKFAEKLKNSIDKDVRTYDGVEYATREERAKIEKNDADIKEKIRGIQSFSENQVEKIYLEIEKGKFSDSCKKQCKKEIEDYYDDILKNEYQNIDNLSKEELLSLRAKIQGGKYSKKCKGDFFKKIDKKVQDIDAASNKLVLEQMLSTIDENDLCGINGALNQIMGKDTLDENDNDAIVKLLNMQIKIAKSLYEPLVGDYISAVNDFIYIESIRGNSDNACVQLKAYYQKYCKGDKGLRFLDDEVPLVFYMDSQCTDYIVSNKRVMINTQAYTIEADLRVIGMEGSNVYHLYKNSTLSKITLKRYIPAEKYQKDISMVKKYKLNGESESTYIAKKFTDFLNRIYCEASAISQMNELLNTLPSDSTALKAFTKEQLEKEYDKWKNCTQYGSKVTKYLSLVEETVCEVYKKEVGTLCANLSSMSVSELTELKFKINKEFSNVQFAHVIKEEKDKINAELQRKKEIEAVAELEEDKAKVSSLSSVELEELLGKWSAYRGNLQGVNELISTIVEQIKVACKEEASKMCSELENLSIQETKELLDKLKKTFTNMEYIKEEIASVEEMVVKKQEQEIKAWMPDKIGELSEDELSSLIARYNSKNYEPSLDSLYARPLFERRNELFAEKAENLMAYVKGKASSVDRIITYETKEGILDALNRQSEVAVDSLVCKIGVVPECCCIYMKKFVIDRTEILWDDIAYFEFKKKFLGSTLNYQCKGGSSGVIKLTVPTEFLLPIADLLNEIHKYIVSNKINVSTYKDGIIHQNTSVLKNENVQNFIASDVGVQEPESKEIIPAVDGSIQLTKIQHSFAEVVEFVNHLPSTTSNKIISTCETKFVKKRQNAVKAYAIGIKEEEIFALYDDTLFGSGKEGFVMTMNEIIIKTSFRDTFKCSYSDIKRIMIIFDESAKLTKILLDTKQGRGTISGSCGESGSQALANQINEIVKFLFGLEKLPYAVEKSSQVKVEN